MLAASGASLLLTWVWLPRRSDWAAWTAVLCAWFAFSNLWKTAMIQGHLDSAVNLSPAAWAWQAASLVGCVFFCQTVSRRYWVRLLWVLHLVLAWLFLFDQIYERYFDDLPGMYLLTQLAQAGSALPSALEIWRHEDWAFVLDVFLFLPLLRRASPLPPSRRAVAPLWAAVILLALVMGSIMSPENQRILRLRFRNVAAVQILGLFHYHFYDVLQGAYSRYENVFDPSFDETKLRDVVTASRRSMLADTGFRGRYKGKNLLVFQLESVESFVLNRKIAGQEITPFLNSLARESFSGSLQDQSGQGRSSDGEFILNNSLLPPGERPLVYAYPSNYFCGLPAILAKQGYHTVYGVPYYGSFWNSRFMSKRYGFMEGLFREQLPNKAGRTIGWGLNDLGLVERLLEYWVDYKQPLYAYTVTMMGHHPYRELDPDQEQLELPSRFADTMLGRYLQLCRERDSEWKQIVALLKKEGWWQNSVVVMVGDHDARLPYEELKLLDDKPTFDEVDKANMDSVMLLIHAPDGKLRGHAPPFAAQVDLAPTLLHLMGAHEQPTAMVGLNLLSKFRRTAVVSKGGYALDSQVMVTDNGGEWTAFSRQTHAVIPNDRSLARREMATWYDLSRDILRLNLVETMQLMGRQ